MRLAAYVFIFIESYLLFLFLTSHQIRFLLPAVIMVPVLLTLLFDTLYTYLKTALSEKKYRLLMRATATGLNLLFLLIFLGNFHYFYVKYNYLIGHYSREEYIKTIGGQ